MVELDQVAAGIVDDRLRYRPRLVEFTEEAAAFMKWLEERCKEMEPDGSLQMMYRIDGRHDLTEETLDHLEGYRGSGPVCTGNGAATKLNSTSMAN